MLVLLPPRSSLLPAHPDFPFAACDNTVFEARCEAGQEVVVHAAQWGARHARADAPLPACYAAGPASPLASCQIDVTTDLQSQCARGASSCTFHANAAHLGAPCTGAPRVLEGAFACRTLPVRAGTAIDFAVGDDGKTVSVTVGGARAGATVAVLHGAVKAVGATGACFADANAHTQLTPAAPLGDSFTVDVAVYVRPGHRGAEATAAPFYSILSDNEDRAFLASNARQTALGLVLVASSRKLHDDNFVKTISLDGVPAGWHRVTIVRRGAADGNHLHYYLDGALQASVSIATEFNSLAAIGNGVGGGLRRPFCGVGAVRVFARALGVSEIAAIGAAAAPLPFAYQRKSDSLQVGVESRGNEVVYTEALVGAAGVNSVVAFEALNPLPAGMVLNVYTGAITGTPTVSTGRAPLTVRVRAYNAAGAVEANVTIAVANPAPVGLAYSQPQAVYAVHAAAQFNVPSFAAGGRAESFSVAPALPAGLELDAVWGFISGTPTQVAAASAHTITARNAAGAAHATVTIAVQATPLVAAAVPAPAAAKFAYAKAQYVVYKGEPIPAGAIVPALTHPGASHAFSVEPALPLAHLGLAFDAATGAVTGTAAEVSAGAVEFTVSAGDARATLVLTVVDTPPGALTYDAPVAVYAVGKRIATNAAVCLGGGGGHATSFEVTPALPAGLSIDRRTGAIRGTPTKHAAEAAYTVRASNSGGHSGTVCVVI